MERLNNPTKPTGISGSALRTWGLLFVALGAFGRGFVQNGLLDVANSSAEQLFQAMQNSQQFTTLAAASLVLHAMETCAVPIFALLLVEGMTHTQHWGKYFARVLGVAVLSEIPYNLAMSGKLLDLNTRNPVFAMVFGLLALYFYNRYSGTGAKGMFINTMVTLAAFLWGMMLQVDHGPGLILILCVVWAFRKKPLYRNFAGAVAAVVCTLVSPFYLAAPMGFLAVHFYNGEKGESNRMVNYLAYPVLLLAVGLAAMLI